MDTQQGQVQRPNEEALQAATEQIGAQDADASWNLQRHYARILEALSSQNPEWFVEVFEENNPFVASEEEILEMITVASDELSKAVLTGIMMMREHLAAVTGMRFIQKFK